MKDKKRASFTYIDEFEVIKASNDLEAVGEKLKLSQFGEYCPDNSLRGYSLIYLLDNPEYYRPCLIVMQGHGYVTAIDREKNYAHRGDEKYK
jgi:hypothetical protein